VIAPLGAGGMGVVYRAEDETLRRVVALKLLPDASGSDERRQRFLREARSAAAITHPNVATVYQVGEAEGRVYIAMELVAGENLRERMNRGRLDLAEARELATQIARGLAAAHAQGIVHRDLKPENVMITPDGVVKLLDFGLAKTALESPASGKTEAALAKTATLVTSDEGRIMGTPEYMSPEQALGAPLDVRSDVFSLGIVLYEMLSGQRPFDGTTTGALLVAIARDTPRPLRQVAPEVDEGLEAIVTRCLAKAPAERFGSAAEIVNALSGQASPRATTVSRTEAAAEPAAKTGDGAKGMALVWVVVGIVAVMAIAGAGAWAVKRGKTGVAAAPVAAGSGSASAAAAASVPTLVARRVTEVPADDLLMDCALTPGGKSVVFVDSVGVWLQPLHGGSRQRLAPNIEGPGVSSCIDAFADRGHVLVTAAGHGEARLWRVPLDGASATLEREWAAETALVTADESRVALLQNNVVRVGPMDGGTSVQVASGAVGAGSFSPDLRHLVVGLQDDGYGTVAATDGSGQVRIDFGGPLNYGLTWDRPDRILFSRGPNHGDACALFELPVDADGRQLSPPRQLWRSNATWLSGLSSQDGRYSVIVLNNHFQVVLADLAPDARSLLGSPRPLTPGKSQSRNAVWLDDDRLAFWSARDDRSAIYEQAATGTEATLRFDSKALPRIEALRAGQLVTCRPTAPQNDGPSRLVVRGEDGAERELATCGSPRDQVRCGARSLGLCILGVEREQAASLSRIDLSTGRAQAPFYTGKEGTEFAVSPDGRQVALVDQAARLTLVDVATGETRSIKPRPAGPNSVLQSVEFTPDGKTLIISGMDFPGADGYAIIAVGLDGRGTVLRATSTWMNYPRVSPDGRHLAFTNMIIDADVWLLEPK
jgi:predicted Ser/Thr protein kinase/WD40 repeat protein